MRDYFCVHDTGPVWDGVDFSPCWTRSILPGLFPLIVLVTSLVVLLPTIARRIASSSKNISLAEETPSTKGSDDEKPSLRRIEDHILLESVHTSVEASVQTGTLDEREKIPVERLGDWIGLIGSIGFVIVQVVYMTTTSHHSWERLALFIYMTLLAATAIPTAKTAPFVKYIPQVHVVALLWLFLPVQFGIFRSALLHHLRDPAALPQRHGHGYASKHHTSSKKPFIFEIILMAHTVFFLVVYTSVPFRTRLDGILQGLKAGKGNGARRKVVIGYAAEETEAYTVNDNPAEPRSVMSRALFSHVIPIVFRHYKNPLQVKDVPAIREDDTPPVSVANWRLDQQEADGHAEDQKSGGAKKKPTKFAFRLFWHFRELFWLQFFWSLWAVIFAFFSPLSLQLLLRFVADRKSDDPNVAGKTPTHVAVLYVALMVIGQLGSSLSQSQILNTGRRICVRSRAVIITEIYCKALRRRDLSGAVAARSVASTDDKSGSEDASKPKTEAVEANITNLVGVDAFFISEIAGYLYYFVTCILCIIVAMVLLYRLLGLSSLAGVVTMILLTPIQGYITKAFASTQKTLLHATDARLEAATEVLSSIKTIKFAAWENKFFDRMQTSRDHELGVLKHRFYLRVLANVMMQITPPLVTIVTFAFYTLYFKRPLTAAIAFTSLSLFSMIRTPLAAVLEMTTATTNAYVSAGRVEDFLNVEETLKYDQLSVAVAPEDPTIGFKNAVIKHAARQGGEDKSATIAESSTSENFRLELDDVNFPVGAMSIIVGSVGSGKSTLLNSLLGETTLLSGKIFMINDRGDRELCPQDPVTGLTDTVAYCPQAPWLIGATIRENILFGRPYEKSRYDSVIAACALERDLEIFEEGDKTIVGEKGTVCSGGQKARIALARAVYSSARTLLCDDVTSAVDAHTASHLYRNCFKGPLMAGRTLILVTHAVGLVLPGTEYAVILEDGEVRGIGSPGKLKAQGHFAEEELEDDGKELTKHLGASGDPKDLPHIEDGTMTFEDLEGHDGEIEQVSKQIDKDNADPAAKREKFFKAENQATGSIGLATYTAYFKYMGSLVYWIFLVLLFVGAQGTQIQTNNWIRSWANAVEEAYSSALMQSIELVRELGDRYKINSPEDDSLYYLMVYVILNVLFGILVAGRTLATFNASLKASRVLYGQLLRAVLGARMRFFDSTPSGQILNRLSNDIQVVDQQAAEVMMLFVNSVLNTVAVFVVVSIATPAFIIAAIFISGLYAIIGALYNATSLEVKRCDSVTKSPVLVGFGEVLQGQTSIRAYADTARFTRELMTRLETNIRAFHLLWQNNRLLSVYCDVAGSLVIIFAATFVLLNDKLSAGAAGLSLSYAMTFTDFVLWIVRLWAANEQNMTSVERLQEYLKLEPEAIPEAKEPPAYWPTKEAKIEVEDLTCAYAPELPPVLKGVSFVVQPGERVGVCGRTGSGKSTLALSLFRFIEASSGSIKIDGIDISSITLTALRERLTILPQEAQLFSGSVRENLDPFNDHDDEIIWDALRRCGLASRNTPGPSRLTSRAPSRAASLHEHEEDGSSTAVEEKVMINSLDERVAKGGANYSAGQRQLLSLARGLLKLRHSSILILDESTANLDHATDEAIQRVLRESLDGVTVITIAHRLRSVADCDKILVLDHGKVLEYDSPLTLMKREDSAFRDLCKRSGEESTLLRIAEEAEEDRRRPKA